MGAAGNRNIFFVISFMKRAFSNSRRIIIVDGETREGDKAEKAFHGIVAQ